MKPLNYRGQASIFTVVTIIILFVILLGLALAPIISTTSSVAVSVSGLTGLEAFMISNLLLWVILIFIIWAIWVTR